MDIHNVSIFVGLQKVRMVSCWGDVPLTLEAEGRSHEVAAKFGGSYHRANVHADTFSFRRQGALEAYYGFNYYHIRYTSGSFHNSSDALLSVFAFSGSSVDAVIRDGRACARWRLSTEAGAEAVQRRGPNVTFKRIRT